MVQLLSDLRQEGLSQHCRMAVQVGGVVMWAGCCQSGLRRLGVLCLC